MKKEKSGGWFPSLFECGLARGLWFAPDPRSVFPVLMQITARVEVNILVKECNHFLFLTGAEGNAFRRSADLDDPVGTDLGIAMTVAARLPGLTAFARVAIVRATAAVPETNTETSELVDRHRIAVSTDRLGDVEKFSTSLLDFSFEFIQGNVVLLPELAPITMVSPELGVFRDVKDLKVGNVPKLLAELNELPKFVNILRGCDGLQPDLNIALV